MENELIEAYFELWAAVENGIDNDNFFELREKYRHIKELVYTTSQPLDYPAILQEQQE